MIEAVAHTASPEIATPLLAGLDAVVPPAQDAPDGELARPPHHVLVESLLERSPADLAWLNWLDGTENVVVVSDSSGVLPSAIDEFPRPSRNPLTVHRGSRDGAWATWCRGRGILSCMVVPVVSGTRVLGTLGLASCTTRALDAYDIERLQLAASLALQTRRYEVRLSGLRGLFDEVSRTLENALALDRALRLPPTFREIARSVGESLDASYCQIAIHDAKRALTIRAAGGHRVPRKPATVAWPLQQLRRCDQALSERRAVVLTFTDQDAGEPERDALFSPLTRTGVILPFFAGPRSQGVLIIGEERQSRCQPMSPERVAILELVASRIAHILRMSRQLEQERLGERRRQRRLTVERQRLAREVHDEVGQALSALLVLIRCSIAEGKAEPEALKLLELTASDALNGARALAYGFRHLKRGIGPMEEARSFAETLLRTVGCRLSWIEERNDGPVALKTLREIGSAIKEAVTNIVRHSRADHARIRVEYPDGRIRVTILDNGVGFVPREAKLTRDGRGLGLAGGAERLARVGGLFEVRSAQGRGTVVVLEAPRQ